MRRSALSLACALCISACSTSSLEEDIAELMAPFEPEALFVYSPAAEEEATEEEGMARWWERLDDPLLNRYVDQLLQDNLSLQEAAQRVIQAQERVAMIRGEFYPNLGVDADGGRSFAPDSTRGGDRSYNTAYNAGLTTAWELDVFGRIRSSTDSFLALYEASLYDREAVEQALIADLVRRRVGIAVNAHLMGLAQQTSKSQQFVYDLVKRRYDLGASGTTVADVYLAEESYRTAQADVHNFKRQLMEESYQLDILLGQVPGSTNPLEADFPLLPPPRDVALCLPASLLDRRPDLRASQLRVEAAKADVDVAIADLYPTFTLGGSLGFTGDDIGNLFRTEQLVGSLLGNITSKLFEGGALRANIRLQEAEAHELAAAYANDILEALREVETALNAEQELGRELAQKDRSVEVLRNAERITQERYRQGIETLRDLLETQQRRYAIERNWLNTQRSKWESRIDLYLALGGDWTQQDQPAERHCDALTPSPLTTEQTQEEAANASDT